MVRLAAGLLLVPLADQLIKFLLRRRLGAGTVSLGPLGSVRVVEARIWWSRPRRHLAPAMMWTTWFLAAIGLTAMAWLVPAYAWFAGMLLGGSLSHALETSFRGAVRDYVCFRFWPAFNLADVAITVGAIGVVLVAFLTIAHGAR